MQCHENVKLSTRDREEYMRVCDSVCVKIVAECKEYVSLETVAIQDTQDRVFLFIRYLYPDETRPETIKRLKKWADLRGAKVGEPSRISSISVRRDYKNL